MWFLFSLHNRALRRSFHHLAMCLESGARLDDALAEVQVAGERRAVREFWVRVQSTLRWGSTLSWALQEVGFSRAEVELVERAEVQGLLLPALRALAGRERFLEHQRCGARARNLTSARYQYAGMTPMEMLAVASLREAQRRGGTSVGAFFPLSPLWRSEDLERPATWGNGWAQVLTADAHPGLLHSALPCSHGLLSMERRGGWAPLCHLDCSAVIGLVMELLYLAGIPYWTRCPADSHWTLEPEHGGHCIAVRYDPFGSGPVLTVEVPTSVIPDAPWEQAEVADVLS